MTVEVGAASTWVSHGIETCAFVGSLLGVEMQSIDGEFEVEKQLSALQTIAGEDWSFVAVHPAASDALVDGANASALIAANGSRSPARQRRRPSR